MKKRRGRRGRRRGRKRRGMRRGRDQDTDFVQEGLQLCLTSLTATH